MNQTTLLLGDCLEKLKELPDNSIDSIVTDPPYGLGKEPDALEMLKDWLETGHHEVKGKGFMGKEWDAFVPQPQVWRECLRVLKPGGHLLAFAGTRTQDLMCLGLRLAGFEIRDMVAWVYGSGFPKSLDVSKALDKMAGAEPIDLGPSPNWRESKRDNGQSMGSVPNEARITAPATEAAKQWDGWGTALKPALEPITLARKPLDGTVAANVLKWHVGGLNIDACRVGSEGGTSRSGQAEYPKNEDGTEDRSESWARTGHSIVEINSGRFPANLIHDGSDEVVALFPDSKGQQGDLVGHNKNRESPHGCFGMMAPANDHIARKDSGSAARFFYCAKTSKKDRNDGCNDLDDSFMAASNQAQAQLKRGVTEHQGDSGTNSIKSAKNNHPTVKPTDLMRYLCRLITPQGGVILDPYMGSGSTGKAAMQEGNFSFIGIERDPDYFRIAETRINAAKAALVAKPVLQPDLFETIETTSHALG